MFARRNREIGELLCRRGLMTPRRWAEVGEAAAAGGVAPVELLAAPGELPFAAAKRSGTGREMALPAADEFVNKKLVRVG